MFRRLPLAAALLLATPLAAQQDRLLGFDLFEQAVMKRGLAHHFGQGDTATHRLDGALVSQLSDVAADGLAGYLEAAEQFFDRHRALLAENIEDLIASLFGQHVHPPVRPPPLGWECPQPPARALCLSAITLPNPPPGVKAAGSA